MELKQNYAAVSSPWWSEVWIVACGPSAQRFDLDRLKGKQVLCVNESIRLLGSAAAPPALFTLDQRWVGQRRDFLAGYQGEKYVALPLETWPDRSGIPGVTYLRLSTADGLSDDLGVICGHESGRGAINLAVLKRAREIHLVGYDMDPAENEKWIQWLPRYRPLARALEQRGVTVINHNMDSHVDVFPKAA